MKPSDQHSLINSLVDKACKMPTKKDLRQQKIESSLLDTDLVEAALAVIDAAIQWGEEKISRPLTPVEMNLCEKLEELRNLGW